MFGWHCEAFKANTIYLGDRSKSNSFDIEKEGLLMLKTSTMALGHCDKVVSRDS